MPRQCSWIVFIASRPWLWPSPYWPNPEPPWMGSDGAPDTGTSTDDPPPPSSGDTGDAGDDEPPGDLTF